MEYFLYDYILHKCPNCPEPVGLWRPHFGVYCEQEQFMTFKVIQSMAKLFEEKKNSLQQQN